MGRNKALKMADGSEKSLVQGPDIVARKGGRVVVAEVKGSSGRLSMSNSRYTSKLDNRARTQPSFSWLDLKQDRYLNTMRDASDAKINEAYTELKKVLDKNNPAPYEAIWLGYGQGGTKFGKLDEAMVKLRSDPLDAQKRGAAEVKVFAIDGQ